MFGSNKVAIALAGLALVVASTGTAVAVTSSSVNISDPTAPTHVAHVDSSGRLQTIGATSTYSYSSLLFGVNSQNNFVTAPTTASLALTSLSLSSPSQIAGIANTEVRVYLYKVSSSSMTSCVPTSYSQLYAWNLAPGDDISTDLSVPLLLRPTGTTPYCLSLYAYAISGSTYGASYYPFGNVSWYVAGGTYSGPATNSAQLSPAQVKKQSSQHTDR